MVPALDSELGLLGTHNDTRTPAHPLVLALLGVSPPPCPAPLQGGLTSADEEILGWLRRAHSNKPVILAVNKCENAARADLQAAEFWGLGTDPIPVSAISGTGAREGGVCAGMGWLGAWGDLPD